MKCLSKNEILYLHHRLIEMYGGEDGIRDEGMLDSAINSPFQTFDGKDIYPTLAEKASALGYQLAMDHPFVDGNKRMGAHAMLVFLALNGVRLSYTQDELAHIFYSIAESESTREDLRQWILSHIL